MHFFTSISRRVQNMIASTKDPWPGTLSEPLSLPVDIVPPGIKEKEAQELKAGLDMANQILEKVKVQWKHTWYGVDGENPLNAMFNLFAKDADYEDMTWDALFGWIFFPFEIFIWILHCLKNVIDIVINALVIALAALFFAIGIAMTVLLLFEPIGWIILIFVPDGIGFAPLAGAFALIIWSGGVMSAFFIRAVVNTLSIPLAVFSAAWLVFKDFFKIPFFLFTGLAALWYGGEAKPSPPPKTEKRSAMANALTALQGLADNPMLQQLIQHPEAQSMVGDISKELGISPSLLRIAQSVYANPTTSAGREEKRPPLSHSASQPVSSRDAAPKGKGSAQEGEGYTERELRLLNEFPSSENEEIPPGSPSSKGGTRSASGRNLPSTGIPQGLPSTGGTRYIPAGSHPSSGARTATHGGKRSVTRRSGPPTTDVPPVHRTSPLNTVQTRNPIAPPVDQTEGSPSNPERSGPSPRHGQGSDDPHTHTV